MRDTTHEDDGDGDGATEAVTLDVLTAVVRATFGVTAARVDNLTTSPGAVGGTLIVAETIDGDTIEVGEVITDDPDWLILVQNSAMAREMANFVGVELLRLVILRQLARLGRALYRFTGGKL